MQTLINVFFYTDDYSHIQEVGDYAVNNIDADITYTSHSLTDLRITVSNAKLPKNFIKWVKKNPAVESVEVWSRVQI